MEQILKLRPIGNSVGFTLSKPIRERMGLGVDALVKFSFEGNRLILEPSNEIDIDGLVSQMTKENCHAEIGTGYSLGNEF